MSLEFSPIDQALFDWVLGVFPTLNRENVRWENQNLPQPSYPFVTFRRSSLLGNGTPDETRETTDLTKPAGEEITRDTRSVREFTLFINAHVDEASGAKDPDNDAFWMLTKLQISLSQLSVAELFELAGISVIEDLGVDDLSRTQNGQFFSKANLDIRLRVCFSSTESAGYINTANVKSIPSDPPQSDDVSDVDITV